MTAPSDTHRRAAIRGEESVAKWRISSGVWAARVFAVLFAATAVFPLLRLDAPNWGAALTLSIIAAGILVASELLRRGSRAAAIILFLAFVGAKLGAWLLAGEPIYQGALWTVVIAAALANGVWGAFALAEVRRKAAQIPPVPARNRNSFRQTTASDSAHEASIREFCEALYCAYAPLDAFTVSATGEMQFSARATDAGVQVVHRVAFIGVRDLTRNRAVPEQPGVRDTLELSVVELEREAAGWRAWFNPFYVEEIEFHCERIFLDGFEVIGTGRWLQDELPARGTV